MSLPDPDERPASWYTRDGELVYDVGLREARKRGLIPRVSSIIETVYSGERFHLAAAAELAREEPERSPTDVANACANHGTRASRFGTNCHAAIDGPLRCLPPTWDRGGDWSIKIHLTAPPSLAPYVAPVWYHLVEHVGSVVAVEHTIVSPNGYAGTIDAVSEMAKLPPNPKRPRRRRVEFFDYKSQGAALQVQRKWGLQFGAYADAWLAVYGYLPTRVSNLMFSRKEPGLFRAYSDWDVRDCVRAWRQCFALWKWVNRWES